MLNLTYLFAKIFDNTILKITLDCVGFVYSLIFAYQEIPALTMNDKYLKKIIKRAYKFIKPNFILGSADKRNSLETILLFLTLNDGVILTYNFLKKKNDDLFNSNLFDALMSIQNRYFWNVIENEGAIKAGIYENDLEISLEKNINSAFNNIYIDKPR